MRLTNFFAATALLIGSAGMPLASLQAEGKGLGQNNEEYQAICEGVVATNPDATFGECMSFFLSAEPAFYGAHLCDGLLEQGVLEELGITFSQCVRFYRQQ